MSGSNAEALAAPPTMADSPANAEARPSSPVAADDDHLAAEEVSTPNLISSSGMMSDTFVS